MNLSTRQLRAFLMLADERHFTHAAQRCHLTQPAFSALIRSLEDAAGVRLFDRSTRRVELTVEGQVLEQSARRLLDEFELTFEDLRNHAERRRGRVSIAALPSLAADWIPGLLAQYHRTYPGITLQLHDALLDDCLNMVQRGEVDFAVAAQRPDMSGLECEFLCDDPYFVVCRKDHPLADRPQLTLADLGNWPVIQMTRSSSVRKQLDAILGVDALPSWLEVEHLATLSGLVRAGLGISLVPAMTLFHFKAAELRIKPLSGTTLTRSLYLVQRKGRALSLAAAPLYDLLLSHRKQIACAPE